MVGGGRAHRAVEVVGWSEPLLRLSLSCRLNPMAAFTGCFGDGRLRRDPSETPVGVGAELWAGLQGGGQDHAPPRPPGLSGRKKEEQTAFFDSFEENNNP